MSSGGPRADESPQYHILHRGFNGSNISISLDPLRKSFVPKQHFCTLEQDDILQSCPRASTVCGVAPGRDRENAVALPPQQVGASNGVRNVRAIHHGRNLDRQAGFLKMGGCQRQSLR